MYSTTIVDPSRPAKSQSTSPTACSVGRPPRMYTVIALDVVDEHHWSSQTAKQNTGTHSGEGYRVVPTDRLSTRHYTKTIHAPPIAPHLGLDLEIAIEFPRSSAMKRQERD